MRLRADVRRGLKSSHRHLVRVDEVYSLGVHRNRLSLIKSRVWKSDVMNGGNHGGRRYSRANVLGIGEFPRELRNYSGSVVELVDVMVDSANNLTYSLVGLDYRLKIERGSSKLVQIVSVDMKDRIMNARRVGSGMVSYRASLDVNARISLEAVGKPYPAMK